MSVTDDDALAALKRNLLDLLQEAVAGTQWEPESGGLVTEAVVVLGWADAQGGYGESWILCGSPWGCEGLMVRALRDLEDQDDDEYG